MIDIMVLFQHLSCHHQYAAVSMTEASQCQTHQKQHYCEKTLIITDQVFTRHDLSDANKYQIEKGC